MARVQRQAPAPEDLGADAPVSLDPAVQAILDEPLEDRPWQERPLSPSMLQQRVDRRSYALSPWDQDDVSPLPGGPSIDLDMVRALPPFERLLILGKFWGETTFEEMAMLLKVHETTVQRRFHKTMARLRDAASAAVVAVPSDSRRP